MARKCVSRNNEAETMQTIREEGRKEGREKGREEDCEDGDRKFV